MIRMLFTGIVIFVGFVGGALWAVRHAEAPPAAGALAGPPLVTEPARAAPAVPVGADAVPAGDGAEPDLVGPGEAPPAEPALPPEEIELEARGDFAEADALAPARAGDLGARAEAPPAEPGPAPLSRADQDRWAGLIRRMLSLYRQVSTGEGA